MLEKSFTDRYVTCHRGLGLPDQALAEDTETNTLGIWDVHKALPSLSVFSTITCLRNSSQKKTIVLFSVPLDTCYLAVLFMFQSHTCSLCLMAAIQCQQITPKNKQALPLTC